MNFTGALTLTSLLRQFSLRVGITWLMLIAEIALLALIPLFLGRAIDELLADANLYALQEIGIVFLALLIVGIGRRAYDTRAYGTMRVVFSNALIQRSDHKSVSQLNAQVTMGRELVDFLEEHTPILITCVIQIIVSIAILFSFAPSLGLAGLGAVAAMALFYALFHRRFFNLNAGLNEISEQQVAVLEAGDSVAIKDLLFRHRKSEVKISDTDSIMFGLVYLAMFALILANLWFASDIPGVTAGAIFAILTYSWELVGSSVELPVVLQQWTRLAEIQERINR